VNKSRGPTQTGDSHNTATLAGPPRKTQVPVKVTEQHSHARVSAELRRRRTAAQRLPALDSGHSDPLDALAGLCAAQAEYDVITLGLCCPHDAGCSARTEAG